MFWENEKQVEKKIKRWTDFKTDILFSPCDIYKEKLYLDMV